MGACSILKYSLGSQAYTWPLKYRWLPGIYLQPNVSAFCRSTCMSLGYGYWYCEIKVVIRSRAPLFTYRDDQNLFLGTGKHFRQTHWHCREAEKKNL